MKHLTAILLSIALGLMWIASGMPQYGYTPTHCPPQGVNATAEQTFTVMRQSLSLFELPVQARVPAAEQAQSAARVHPLPMPENTVNPAGSSLSKNLFNPGGGAPRFPQAARSVDRYVYGLRKIVI